MFRFVLTLLTFLPLSALGNVSATHKPDPVTLNAAQVAGVDSVIDSIYGPKDIDEVVSFKIQFTEDKAYAILQSRIERAASVIEQLKEDKERIHVESVSVDGETVVATHILRAQISEALYWEVKSTLARVHRLSVESLKVFYLVRPSSRSTTKNTLIYSRDLLSRPIWEEGLSISDYLSCKRDSDCL